MTVASPKITSVEKARQSLRPVEPEFAKKKLSSYFPKDSIFSKIKTYLLKNKEGQEQKLDADWRHLHIGGFKVILFKGVALSKEQLGHFNKDATAHYLENREKAPTAAQIKKAEEEEVLRQTREKLLIPYDLLIDDDGLFETLGKMKNKEWDKLVAGLEEKKEAQDKLDAGKEA